MGVHRQILAAGSLALIFVGFVIGVVTGVRIGLLSKTPEAWQINPDFRREEVDPMFAEYKAGRALYTLGLPIVGHVLNVQIVNETRLTREGFVPLGELGEPTRFWYVKPGECYIYQYNGATMFVQLRTKYAMGLKHGRIGTGRAPEKVRDETDQPSPAILEQ